MPQRSPIRPCVVAFAIVLTSILGGCGGGGGSGSQSTDPPTSSGDPSAAFLKPGSPTNEVVEYGHESTPSEREAAAVVLTKNLRAREEGDFKTQCATVAKVVAENLSPQVNASAAVKACPQKLQEIATPLSKTKAFRVDTFDGEIVALRVKGTTGDALYHGTDGKDHAMQMVKERGKWLVGNITVLELNPPKTQKATKGHSESNRIGK